MQDKVIIYEQVDPAMVHTPPPPKAPRPSATAQCKQLPAGAPEELRRLNHANKMARKAIRRAQWHAARRDMLAGAPAGINRHTGEPHHNFAERMRCLTQAGGGNLTPALGQLAADIMRAHRAPQPTAGTA